MGNICLEIYFLKSISRCLKSDALQEKPRGVAEACLCVLTAKRKATLKERLSFARRWQRIQHPDNCVCFIPKPQSAEAEQTQNCLNKWLTGLLWSTLEHGRSEMRCQCVVASHIWTQPAEMWIGVWTGFLSLSRASWVARRVGGERQQYGRVFHQTSVISSSSSSPSVSPSASPSSSSSSSDVASSSSIWDAHFGHEHTNR